MTCFFPTHVAGLVILLGCSACRAKEWTPDQLGRGRTSSTHEELELGREVYSNYCVGCHGEAGDGNGPAARFLDPKPRDFRVGRIKFADVASGEAPRDEDYVRVISHGLSGTAMPSFGLLPERERFAVTAYIKKFYGGWEEDGEGGAISAGKDPWVGDLKGALAEGAKTYHGLAKCWSCHPAYVSPTEIERLTLASDLPEPDLRPNLYESEVKESQWGASIRAPDFLADRIKNGSSAEEVVRVIAAGVGGTAMPTWAGTLEPEQIWGLAHYIHSISVLRGTPEGRILKTKLSKEVVPTNAGTETP
jgi:mono/diheme cytochrome c family protein